MGMSCIYLNDGIKLAHCVIEDDFDFFEKVRWFRSDLVRRFRGDLECAFTGSLWKYILKNVVHMVSLDPSSGDLFPSGPSWIFS
jgi:hypothetical protein